MEERNCIQNAALTVTNAINNAYLNNNKQIYSKPTSSASRYTNLSLLKFDNYHLNKTQPLDNRLKELTRIYSGYTF